MSFTQLKVTNEDKTSNFNWAPKSSLLIEPYATLFQHIADTEGTPFMRTLL